MEPGSGIMGFGKAFLDEDPLQTAINRGAGVIQSIPVVGDAITGLGESAYDLTQKFKDFDNWTKKVKTVLGSRSTNQAVYDAAKDWYYTKYQINTQNIQAKL